VITKWKVFNFKSVRNETELPFAPLTIFAGVNSSGKSTFLQTILLISQTLEHRVSSRSVVLNGALTRLGQFDDVCSTNGEADQIVIGFECQVPEEKEESPYDSVSPFRSDPLYYEFYDAGIDCVRCELSFDSDRSSPQRDVYQLQPRLFGCTLAAHLKEAADNEDETNSIAITNAAVAGDTQITKIRRLAIAEPGNETAKVSLDWNVALDDRSQEEIREAFQTAEAVGCVLRHFLPTRLSLRINRTVEDSILLATMLSAENVPIRLRRYSRAEDIYVPEKVVEIVRNLLNESPPSDRDNLVELENLIADSLRSRMTLPRWSERIRGLPIRQKSALRRAMSRDPEIRDKIATAYRQDKAASYELVTYRLPGSLRAGVSYLEHFFSGFLKYLGPLRDEPKAMYPLTGAHDPSDVGLRGEHTAAVLDVNKTRQIVYIPSTCFSSTNIVIQPTTRSLDWAVVDWLQYLGVASSVNSHDRGKFGHELKVSVSVEQQSHDLTHVGVGVSQVLPILVSSLLAESDSTLIFEQPELHLHPRVQTLLADFFLSMIALGKQCLVETHSEYLINRLRFRVAAADENSSWASKLKVYFVEKGTEGSKFREVRINEYGAILDWPEGFFDQSPREAEDILRAAMAKKQKRAHGRKPNA
jgi:predicted ATPase